MVSVAIQPSGNADSRAHYRDTIESPVDLTGKSQLLGSERATLNKLYPGRLAPLWGVTPGKNGANVSKYERLSRGDIVLFTRDNYVVSSGVIEMCFRNRRLARSLWGLDKSGQTWELMYALSNVQDQNIPYSILRGAIGSEPGDNFQGFRVLNRAKSEGALELLGIEVEAEPWSISPGEELKRSEVHRLYGGAHYGGIEPSRKSANILLFTNPHGKSEYGYDFDGPDEDGTFLYTGDGQTGDQSPEIGGNKQVLEHRKSRRALRLFEVTETQTVVRYVGEFELGVPQYQIRRAKDIEGNERSVLVFKLVPIGVTKPFAPEGALPLPGELNRRPSERTGTLQHLRTAPQSVSVAERREIQLQERYKSFLVSQGRDVDSYDIVIPDSRIVLKPDLVDFTSKTFIEVKSGVSRGFVREAIGQILDYTFQAAAIGPDVWQPAILLPGVPTRDLAELIESLGISLIWEVDGKFATSERADSDVLNL